MSGGAWFLPDEDWNPVACDDIQQVQAFLGSIEKKRISYDDFGEAGRVSTVFLPTDHQLGDGPPIHFETMIFGGPHDDYQVRYSTVEAAREGHRQAVSLVTQGINKNTGELA